MHYGAPGVLQVQLPSKMGVLYSIVDSAVTKSRMCTGAEQPERHAVLVERDGVVQLVLDDEVHHGPYGKMIRDDRICKLVLR